MIDTSADTARLALVLSAVAGIVIAIWLTAMIIGWDEDRVAEWIPESGLAAAAVIVLVLAGDTVLPIPATLVMLGSGATLGPVTGSIVNMVGLAIGAALGYGLGHRLSRGGRDDAPEQPLWTVAATRGLPLLSESVAISAGMLRSPFRRFSRAAALGSLGAGVVYSTAGWLATNHWSLILLAAFVATTAWFAATTLGSFTAPRDGPICHPEPRRRSKRAVRGRG